GGGWGVGRSAPAPGGGARGFHPPLPALVRRLAYATALPWAVFTLVIYSMILFGGFVETWGRNHRFSLRHYAAAFAVDVTDFGLHWKGAAWNSFWTTLEIAAVSAPLTAALGLLTAYLLVRQRFRATDVLHILAAGASAFPRQGGVGVRHDAQLRDSRDRDRDQLHPGLQHAADRADRHGDHPGHLLRLPQHAGGRPRRHRVDDPDRSKPG